MTDNLDGLSLPLRMQVLRRKLTLEQARLIAAHPDPDPIDIERMLDGEEPITLGRFWPTSTPVAEPPSDSQQSKEAFLLECLIDATEQAAALRKELAEHRQRLHDLEQIVLHLAEVTR